LAFEADGAEQSVQQRVDDRSAVYERQRHSETLWARTWVGQFRKLVMKSAVRNVERAIEGADR
jgi:hypothetical protein